MCGCGTFQSATDEPCVCFMGVFLCICVDFFARFWTYVCLCTADSHLSQHKQ